MKVHLGGRGGLEFFLEYAEAVAGNVEGEQEYFVSGYGLSGVLMHNSYRFTDREAALHFYEYLPDDPEELSRAFRENDEAQQEGVE